MPTRPLDSRDSPSVSSPPRTRLGQLVRVASLHFDNLPNSPEGRSPSPTAASSRPAAPSRSWEGCARMAARSPTLDTWAPGRNFPKGQRSARLAPPLPAPWSPSRRPPQRRRSALSLPPPEATRFKKISRPSPARSAGNLIPRPEAKLPSACVQRLDLGVPAQLAKRLRELQKFAQTTCSQAANHSLAQRHDAMAQGMRLLTQLNGLDCLDWDRLEGTPSQIILIHTHLLRRLLSCDDFAPFQTDDYRRTLDELIGRREWTWWGNLRPEEHGDLCDAIMQVDAATEPMP